MLQPQRMSTTQRAAANRANAEKSTGPKSPHGKDRVRFNAVKHHITSQIHVIPAHLMESWKAFEKFGRKALNPMDGRQEIVALEILQLRFRLQTAAAMESRILSVNAYGLEASECFESGDPVIDEALAAAIAFEKELPSLNLLSLYESRFSRRLEKAERHYESLQQERASRIVSERKECALLYKHLKRKGLQFDPQRHGFVISIAEIEAYIELQELYAELNLPRPKDDDDQNPPKDGNVLPLEPEKEAPRWQTAS